MQKLMFKGSAVKDDDSTLRQVRRCVRQEGLEGLEGRVGRVGSEGERTALDVL